MCTREYVWDRLYKRQRIRIRIEFERETGRIPLNRTRSSWPSPVVRRAIARIAHGPVAGKRTFHLHPGDGDGGNDVGVVKLLPRYAVCGALSECIVHSLHCRLTLFPFRPTPLEPVEIGAGATRVLRRTGLRGTRYLGTVGTRAGGRPGDDVHV